MNNRLKHARIALTKNEFKKAYNLSKKINSNPPDRSYDSLQVQGISALQMGKFDEAEQLFKDAISFAPNNHSKSLQFGNLAFIARTKGDKQSYFHRIEKSIALCADYKVKNSMRLELAGMLSKELKYKEANNIYLKLKVYSEFELDANLGLFINYLRDYNLEKLISLFEQTKSRLRDMSQAQLNDFLYASERTPFDLDELFDVAEQISSNKTEIAVLRGSYKASRGLWDDLAFELEKVEEQSFESKDVKRIYYRLKHQFADRNKQYEEAFRYAEMFNHLKASQMRESNSFEKDESIQTLNISEYSEPTQTQNFILPDGIKLAFLVGFPRSGTTLLENILDTDERIIAWGEVGSLTAVKAKLINDGYLYPKSLGALGESYKEELREYYINYVLRKLNLKSFKGFELAVDKNPLSIKDLPLIKCLFPASKVITAIRHPLDCCLSCFFQDFESNPETNHFLSLQDSVERYFNIFELYLNYKTNIEFDECICRYEDIVSDFAGEMGKLYEFLQISLNVESIMDFHKKSKKKIITSASYSQVRNPIYKSSRYRWENYYEQIKPFAPRLDKFAVYWGYEKSL